jgi:Tol biopolymer transport system component
VGDYTGVGWTPDSRTIVFAGRGPSGALRLHAQPIDGRPARAVAALALRGSRRFPVDPAGARVAVSGAEGGLAFVSLHDGTTEAVPGSTSADRAIAWSPDGGSLFVRRGMSAVVERLDVRTGVRSPAAEMRTRDTIGALGPLSPVITPDGRYYAFVYARRLSDLYVVEGLR